MTEIPEHLLKRSKNRRRQIGLLDDSESEHQPYTPDTLTASHSTSQYYIDDIVAPGLHITRPLVSVVNSRNITITGELLATDSALSTGQFNLQLQDVAGAEYVVERVLDLLRSAKKTKRKDEPGVFERFWARLGQRSNH